MPVSFNNSDSDVEEDDFNKWKMARPVILFESTEEESKDEVKVESANSLVN